MSTSVPNAIRVLLIHLDLHQHDSSPLMTCSIRLKSTQQVSQRIDMWQKVSIWLSVAILLIAIAVFVYGSFRWRVETQVIREKLEASKIEPRIKKFEIKELEQLPAPVQRYFRVALRPGQSIIAAANIEHRGTFNMSATGEKWSAFSSNQRVVTHRAGFDWDASIAAFPGVHVRVHDAYVSGEGILHAALFGAISLANIRGTPDTAQGEFMRFVAEAAWYPTRMLPSQGGIWETVDDTSAKLTLKDNENVATLLVRFDASGLIASVKADARARVVGNKVTMLPWQGRFWNYAEKDGMRYPQEGEVEWLTPEGAKPYWRGHVGSITYEFTE
jgi:hypothetical protein